MTTISHRKLGRRSSRILQRVQDGETIDVTRNGEITAALIPPSVSPFDRLRLSGQIRPAKTETVDFPAPCRGSQPMPGPRPSWTTFERTIDRRQV